MRRLSFDDVGKEVRLDNLRGKPLAGIVMAIRAPRRICFLFQGRYQKVEEQCEAIKSFMEENSG